MTTQNDQAEYQIDIKTHVTYIEHQSNPYYGRYVFAYTIMMENTGTKAAKLLNRHWLITDSDGKTQEVRGEGVVGEKPYLRPSQKYEYTSGTMITTPVGSMRGSYEMIADDGILFKAKIPTFTLAKPNMLN